MTNTDKTWMLCIEREQQVIDGLQVDVSAVTAKAGLTCPVFMTRRAYDAFAQIPWKSGDPQDASWLRELSSAIVVPMYFSGRGLSAFKLTFNALDGTVFPAPIALVVKPGPLDVKDPQYAITMMLAGEYS